MNAGLRDPFLHWARRKPFFLRGRGGGNLQSKIAFKWMTGLVWWNRWKLRVTAAEQLEDVRATNRGCCLFRFHPFLHQEANGRRIFVLVLAALLWLMSMSNAFVGGQGVVRPCTSRLESEWRNSWTNVARRTQFSTNFPTGCTCGWIMTFGEHWVHVDRGSNDVVTWWVLFLFWWRGNGRCFFEMMSAELWLVLFVFVGGHGVVRPSTLRLEVKNGICWPASRDGIFFVDNVVNRA